MPLRRFPPLNFFKPTVATCFVLLVLLQLCPAQERYVVSSVKGDLNVYNLADSSFVESLSAGANPFQVVASPNRRIGYFSNLDSTYLSVVDFTIRREIKRIYGVESNYNHTLAVTPDGKLLLAPTSQNQLAVIRTSDFQILKRVELAPIVGPASLSQLGSVVAVNNKAYVNSAYNFSNKSAVAVVDLTTLQASAIEVPQPIYNNTFFAGDTATTPDGKFVLMLQSANVLLISTNTDTVVQNIDLPDTPFLIAITPALNSDAVYAYLVCLGSDGGMAAEMMDLRANSPTFGQLIPGASVTLSPGYFTPASIAINGDGSRLIVMALRTTAPKPDTFILDTHALLTNPEHAILRKLRLGNALNPYLHNVTITELETAPPPTAPVVASVEGSVVNDQAGTIQVTGANFGREAFVRIGAMAPVRAQVISDSKLKVTVPQNAPAGDALDVIVTNRNSTAPVAQQQQSGLLPAALKIAANPMFQPGGQVVVSDMSQNAISVLRKTNLMKTFFVGNEPGTFAFAPDGVRVYVESLTPPVKIVCFNLQKNAIERNIPLPSRSLLSPGGMIASTSPTRGTPVIYASTSQYDGTWKIVLLQIDANPSSPTFNQIVDTYGAPIDWGGYGGSTGVTPNGRFAYVNEGGSETLTIFDTVQRSSITLSTASLGVNFYQQNVTVTPDGRTLLLTTPKGAVAVFDISANPFSPALITTIFPVVPQGLGKVYLEKYEVVGKHLFAFDAQHNTLEMFNFDRDSRNYSFLGANVIPGHSTYGVYPGVSLDGKLVYVPQNGDDALAVLDSSLLANNQPALITKLATGRVPNAAAVSPVPWK